MTSITMKRSFSMIEKGGLGMKTTRWVLVMLLCFTLNSGAMLMAQEVPDRSGAASSISVFLNGSQLQFDVEPMLINDRVMVPLRVIFEAMGATVDWNNATQEVTAIKGGTTVKMQVGSNQASINGVSHTLDSPPQIVNSRTLAPLRFVGEAFGGTVSWDGSTQTVNITTNGSVSSQQVVIAGFQFSPQSLTVHAGDTVVWINNDAVDHTIVGTGFSSSPIGQGESFSQVFNTPGTYDYHCGIHPSMTGQIIVE